MLEEAIKKITSQIHQVNSLNILYKLVKKEFGNSYKFSKERLKRIVFKIENIEVKIKKRIVKNKKPEKCPVCGNGLKKVYGKDVFNRVKHIGFKCDKCNFSMGLECALPVKYIFIKK